MAGVAARAGVDEDELLGYGRDDLVDLFKELGIRGVVARNKLLRQSEEQAAARLTALRTSVDPAAANAALRTFRGRESMPEYAALEAYARGEDPASWQGGDGGEQRERGGRGRGKVTAKDLKSKPPPHR